MRQQPDDNNATARKSAAPPRKTARARARTHSGARGEKTAPTPKQKNKTHRDRRRQVGRQAQLPRPLLRADALRLVVERPVQPRRRLLVARVRAPQRLGPVAGLAERDAAALEHLRGEVVVVGELEPGGQRALGLQRRLPGRAAGGAAVGGRRRRRVAAHGGARAVKGPEAAEGADARGELAADAFSRGVFFCGGFFCRR